MDLTSPDPPLLIVVGAGGVGKTTLAASFGLVSAAAGHDTLVMTFDPSLRLKDALGVDEGTKGEEVPVATETPGKLYANLLDARRTFDKLVVLYAPNDEMRRRILENPYYDHLAGHLGGILEYMAVERLYEVASKGRYARIILDTPPTTQAIDFLEAPDRIVDFLDSGALKIALKPWFDDDGHLRSVSGLGFLTRSFERFLDRIVGMKLLRDMSEFFRAFEPLFVGFHQRAEKAKRLLVSYDTLFVLVTGPDKDRIPDTLFFARRLLEGGHHLGPLVVNRVHPEFPRAGGPRAGQATSMDFDGSRLFRWLGERHQRGLTELRTLLAPEQKLIALPLTPDEPTDLASLEAVGRRVQHALVNPR